MKNKITYNIKYGTGYHPSTEFSFMFNNVINESDIVKFSFSPTLQDLGVISAFKFLSKSSGRLKYHQDLLNIEKSKKRFNTHNNLISFSKQIATIFIDNYVFSTTTRGYLNYDPFDFFIKLDDICLSNQRQYISLKYIKTSPLKIGYTYKWLNHNNKNCTRFISLLHSLNHSDKHNISQIYTDMSLEEVTHNINHSNDFVSVFNNSNGLFEYSKLHNISRQDLYVDKHKGGFVKETTHKLNIDHNNIICDFSNINHLYVYESIFFNKKYEKFKIIKEQLINASIDVLEITKNNYQYKLSNNTNGIIKNSFNYCLYGNDNNINLLRDAYLLFDDDNGITVSNDAYLLFDDDNVLNKQYQYDNLSYRDRLLHKESNNYFVGRFSNGLFKGEFISSLFKDDGKIFISNSKSLNSKYSGLYVYENNITLDKHNHTLHKYIINEGLSKGNLNAFRCDMLSQFSKASIIINSNNTDFFLDKGDKLLDNQFYPIFIQKNSDNAFMHDKVFASSTYKKVYTNNSTLLSKSNSYLQIFENAILHKDATYMNLLDFDRLAYKGESNLILNNSMLLFKNYNYMHREYDSFLLKKEEQTLIVNENVLTKKDDSYLYLQKECITTSLDEKNIFINQSMNLYKAESKMFLHYNSLLPSKYDFNLYIFTGQRKLKQQYEKMYDSFLLNKKAYKDEKKVLSDSQKFVTIPTVDEIYINEFDNFAWVKDFLPPMELLKDAIDELLLPHKQFDYSDHKKAVLSENFCINQGFLEYIGEDFNPVISLAIEQPVPYYAELTKDYIDVDVAVMRKVIEILYHYWRKYIHSFVGMEPSKAINRILIEAHEDVLTRFDTGPNNKVLDAERSLKLFAWYSEMTLLTHSLKRLKMKKANATFDFGAGFIPTFNKPLYEVRAIQQDEIVSFHGFLLWSTDCTIRSRSNLMGASLQLRHMCQFHDTKFTCKIYMNGGFLEIITSDNVYRYTRGTHDVEIILPRDNNGFRIVFTKEDLGSYVEIAQFLIHDRYNISYDIEYLSQVKNINYTIQYVLDFLTCAGDAIENTYGIMEYIAPPANALERFLEYMTIHHEKKMKGKRVTVIK